MERVMTLLTDEQETFVWAVFIAGMPTHRASFARVVGIHLNRQTSGKLGFIGDHALQFSKRPLGISSVRFPLLLAPFLAFSSISDVCQMLQADQMARVLCDDAFGDTMIGVLRSPVSLVQISPQGGGLQNECLSFADASSISHNG